jgi:hypothetical protein
LAAIPAKAGMQQIQPVKDILDPGFHRGDDLNSIFLQLQGGEGGFKNFLQFGAHKFSEGPKGANCLFLTKALQKIKYISQIFQVRLRANRDLGMAGSIF